jgi:hypothetical protein
MAVRLSTLRAGSHKEGKAILVPGREGPQGCETSRFSHFLDGRLTDGGESVSLTRQAILVSARGGQYGCEMSRLSHFF